MTESPGIHDIPGTYVFDKRHSRKGYYLNMFCMSLNEEANREAFSADPEAFLDRFRLTTEQRQAVLDRDWLVLLRLGGNIYYTFKLAIFDRISMQAVGGAMCGLTEDEFREIMLTGGKNQKGDARRGPHVLKDARGE